MGAWFDGWDFGTWNFEALVLKSNGKLITSGTYIPDHRIISVSNKVNVLSILFNLLRF